MHNYYIESFEKTRIAGKIAAGALDEVAKITRPGIRTDQIDRLCFEYINDHGAYSTFTGFPTCCTSVIMSYAMEYHLIKF